MNYAPRLSFTYQQLAHWVPRVAMVSDKVIVYEHPDDPANLHCHMLIFGLTVEIKTVKTWLKDSLRQTPARTQWAFPEQYKGEPVNDGFIKYMSKGKYDPKYNKGYTEQFIAEQKALGFDKQSKKGVKATSASAKYYSSFVAWLYDKDSHKAPIDLLNPYTIKKAAWTYMMETTSMPMPYECSLAKASFIRYCYDYSIPLPDDLRKKYDL